MPFEVRVDSSGFVTRPTPWSRRCLESFATWLHQASSQQDHCRGNGQDEVRVVCISDTHGTKPQLPEGDVLIHAGDMSRRGTLEEIQEQLDWLNTQPHPHKVVIAGNHDIVLDDDAVEKAIERHDDRFPVGGQRRSALQWGSILYLQDSSATLHLSQQKKSVKIFGSPMTPECGNWAFQHLPIHNLWRNKIPDDTDILATHGPPKSHLDCTLSGKAAGCPHLLRALHHARPKIHLFGHIHAGRGQERIRFDRATIAYERITVLGEGLGALMSLLLASAVRLVSADVENDTFLVNAAIVQDKNRDEPLPAIVVTI